MRKLWLLLCLLAAPAWGDTLSSLQAGGALNTTTLFYAFQTGAVPPDRKYVFDPTIFSATNGTIGIQIGNAIAPLIPFQVIQGGIGTATASGTALDNITAFSGTGLMNRTGAGAYSFITPPAGSIVGTTATQTLTNKSIDCTANTCTNFPGGAGGGTVTSVATGAGLTGGPITGTGTISVPSHGITNTMLTTIPAHSYKGNNTANPANAIDVTNAQLTADLNTFTSTLQGLVPSSGGGTVNFLRADGSFAQPTVSVTAQTADIVINPTPGQTSFTIGTIAVNNDQSAGPYTVLNSDNTKNILVGAFTYTLPQANVGGFGPAGWYTCFFNKGASNATITTTISTFIGAGGGTSFTLPPNNWACPGSDGTNWQPTLVSPGAFTGTSGHTLPYLDGNNDFSGGTQTFGTTLAKMNLQTGTTYTIAQSDCGRTVKVSNAAPITVTVPSTITGVCHTSVVQGGAGQITVAAGGGATLSNPHGFTKTFGQNAGVGLSNIGTTAADWLLFGDGA